MIPRRSWSTRELGAEQLATWTGRIRRCGADGSHHHPRVQKTAKRLVMTKSDAGVDPLDAKRYAGRQTLCVDVALTG